MSEDNSEVSNAQYSKIVWLAALFLVASCIGCHSRIKHFQRADRNAHTLLREKTAAKPWQLPADFSLIPSPESRMAIRDCIVSPSLPEPTQSLYSYQLPLLRSDMLSVDEGENSGSDSNANSPVGRPIPPDAWATIPKQCLERMLDFGSIRDEANFTREEFADFDLDKEINEDVPKLTLEDVVDLALLNSRDYQTQKETLYLVALRLSQERFAYQSKFTNGATGTALNYDHIRSGGTTVNRLGIPTGVATDRLLVTGGDLLASFANNILLTFNGPSGYAADVSSSILVAYTQPLLQRDIRFESLTQAERDVVYAARDFIRFRKAFFVDFAGIYYDLIRSFRQIEIDSQNFFSLVRAFNQAEAENRRGFVPLVQVDQVEQSLLSSRGSLIGTCNGVEQSLDSLKLSLGIPTETPINIDLEELNKLTLLDQISVSADSSNRVLSRLKSQLAESDRAQMVNTAALLLERIIEASSVVSEDVDSEQIQTLDRLRARFAVDSARYTTQTELASLLSELESETPSVGIIIQRALVHAKSQFNLIRRQLELAVLQRDQIPTIEDSQIDGFEKRRDELAQEVDKIVEEFKATIAGTRRTRDLVATTNSLRGELTQFTQELDAFTGTEVLQDPQEDLARVVEEVNKLITLASSTLDSPNFGLKPIEIDVDDAMITAIVLRFDLMNQRESLFDDWRQIKLASDELKSVLDISASHRINTRAGANQPFNFTLDDSTTSLGLRFDAPLNRFAERNTFRGTLITYQRALRNLAQLEDTIKFSVRNDLRSLALDREQYLIDVASAALAYERVVSTSLEFRLGTGGVTARDFLEAQTAYIGALSRVASRHIDYIVDRTQLFLDLELLTVDENGFWADIKNEDVQPEPAYSIPDWACPVYGKLPKLRYSREMRRLMCQRTSGSSAVNVVDGKVLPEQPTGADVEARDSGNEASQSRDETEPELDSLDSERLPLPSNVEEIPPPPSRNTAAPNEQALQLESSYESHSQRVGSSDAPVQAATRPRWK